MIARLYHFLDSLDPKKFFALLCFLTAIVIFLITLLLISISASGQNVSVSPRQLQLSPWLRGITNSYFNFRAFTEVTNSAEARKYLELGDGSALTLIGGTGISIDQTDPFNPIVSAQGVQTIIAGNGIGVDATDPFNPIVSNTSGNGNVSNFVTVTNLIYYPTNTVTITNIVNITNSGVSTNAVVVPDIASLKTNLATLDQTLFLVAATNGTGGFFKSWSSYSGSFDEGVWIAPNAGAGGFQRQYDNNVFPARWWGAIVTNAVIQSAINFASLQGGGRVIVPNGDFLLQADGTKGLYLSNYVTLEAENNSQLVVADTSFTTDYVLIHASGTTNAGVVGFSLVGNPVNANGLGYGIDFSSSVGFRSENNTFSGFKTDALLPTSATAFAIRDGTISLISSNGIPTGLTTYRKGTLYVDTGSGNTNALWIETIDFSATGWIRGGGSSFSGVANGVVYSTDGDNLINSTNITFSDYVGIGYILQIISKDADHLGGVLGVGLDTVGQVGSFEHDHVKNIDYQAQLNSDEGLGAQLYLSAVDSNNSGVVNVKATTNGVDFALQHNSTNTFYIAPQTGYDGSGTHFLSDDGSYKSDDVLVFGSPTGSIGLSIVDGVVNTALRSDSSLPLDQTIAPVWSGLHTFGSGVALQPVGGIINLTMGNTALNTPALGSYARLSSDSGIATNRIFTLGLAATGQVLVLEWTGTNAGQLIDDANDGFGHAWRLHGDWLPSQYDSIALQFNGTDWIELGRGNADSSLSGVSGSGTSGQLAFWTGASAISGVTNLTKTISGGQTFLDTWSDSISAHRLYSTNYGLGLTLQADANGGQVFSANATPLILKGGNSNIAINTLTNVITTSGADLVYSNSLASTSGPGIMINGANGQNVSLRIGGTGLATLSTPNASTNRLDLLSGGNSGLIILSGSVRPAISGLQFGTSGNPWGAYNPSKTITATGSTGNKTINDTAGKVSFAATSNLLQVTDSWVTTNSIVTAMIDRGDATAKTCTIGLATGSFTIELNAPATAETACRFFIIP